MKSKLIHRDEQSTWALVFATGDEPVSLLERFASQNRLSASQLTGIGAFSDVVLGFFDLDSKEYKRTRIDEQVEVVSLIGDFALNEGKPKLHAHVVVAKRDGSAYGGHLLEAHVRPTLEVIVNESPAHLRRSTDAATGLALIELQAD